MQRNFVIRAVPAVGLLSTIIPMNGIGTSTVGTQNFVEIPQGILKHVILFTMVIQKYEKSAGIGRHHVKRFSHHCACW